MSGSLPGTSLPDSGNTDNHIRQEIKKGYVWKIEVQASVARCLRTPPEPAKAQDFRFGLAYRLRGERDRSMVVVGNYCS